MFAFLALVGAEDVGAGFEGYGAEEGEPGCAGVGLWGGGVSIGEGQGFEKTWGRRGDFCGHGKEKMR